MESPPIWVELNKDWCWVIFTKSWAIGSVELIDKVIRQILIPAALPAKPHHAGHGSRAQRFLLRLSTIILLKLTEDDVNIYCKEVRYF